MKNEKEINILLKRDRKTIDDKSLTISQPFDNMLIKSLDKLLTDNKIERLSIKSVKIAGKMNIKALPTLILKTVKNAITVLDC